MISTACLILLQVSEFHFFSEKKGLKGKTGKKGKSRAQGGEGARRRREEMPCQAETDAKSPVSEAETGLKKCLVRLKRTQSGAGRKTIMHQLAVGTHAHGELGRANALHLALEDDDLAEAFRLAAVRHRLLFLDGEAQHLIEVLGDEGQRGGVLAAPVGRLAGRAAVHADVAPQAVVPGLRLRAALAPLVNRLEDGVPTLGTLRCWIEHNTNSLNIEQNRLR